MLEASLAALFSIQGLLYLTLGIAFGLVVGVLPGLGGMFALSMALPLLLGLDPYHALALFVGITPAPLREALSPLCSLVFRAP